MEDAESTAAGASLAVRSGSSLANALGRWRRRGQRSMGSNGRTGRTLGIVARCFTPFPMASPSISVEGAASRELRVCRS